MSPLIACSTEIRSSTHPREFCQMSSILNNAMDDTGYLTARRDKLASDDFFPALSLIADSFRS
jgi:hypothetical protein